MTKRVQKLIDLGYLAAEVDVQDARVKWIHVTPRGIEDLHRYLFKLKTCLDDNRDRIITGN